MNERISIEEIIRIYNVDHSFVHALIDSELLHPQTENSVQYIIHDELSDFEKFMNWHYDLEVNLQGIEIINDMLRKVRHLQTENRNLLQRLQVTRFDWEESDEVL
ncbi:chaperone modulator CbpM [Chryseobacterium sp. TY3]